MASCLQFANRSMDNTLNFDPSLIPSSGTVAMNPGLNIPAPLNSQLPQKPHSQQDPREATLLTSHSALHPPFLAKKDVWQEGSHYSPDQTKKTSPSYPSLQLPNLFSTQSTVLQAASLPGHVQASNMPTLQLPRSIPSLPNLSLPNLSLLQAANLPLLQAQLPNSQILQQQLPNSQILQQQLPNSQILQPQLPNSQILQQQLPNSQILQQQLPNSQILQQQLPNSQILQQQLPNSQILQQQLSNSQILQQQNTQSFPISPLHQRIVSPLNLHVANSPAVFQTDAPAKPMPSLNSCQPLSLEVQKHSSVNLQPINITTVKTEPNNSVQKTNTSILSNFPPSVVPVSNLSTIHLQAPHIPASGNLIFSNLPSSSSPSGTLSNLQSFPVSTLSNMQSFPIPLSPLSNLQSLPVTTLSHIQSFPVSTLSNLQSLPANPPSNLPPLAAAGASNLSAAGASNLSAAGASNLSKLRRLTTTNLSSLQIPNIATNVKMDPVQQTGSNGEGQTGDRSHISANMASIISNSLNGQLEINKQLMTCLSVALEEIKELRKQLADQNQENQTGCNDLRPEHFKPLDSPSKTGLDSSDLSTPGSISPFSGELQQNSPSPLIDIKTLLKLGEAKDWMIPAMKPSDPSILGSKRSRTGEKLKSNVPAACRSIVKNVYRELVRREAISAFDLHQGQESAHNVKIYWQVIEYIRKTTTNCVWEEADMLYAIRTYWRSLRDDRQRELSGKKYNHRRMIIRREIMKRKLKSRQKAMNLVSWGSEMKQLFEETLSLDYMSSEEEDNTVESREGPRPRVVRRLPWSSTMMTQCKSDLDQEFRKICSARQLKATAHVYRRDHVTSSRMVPPNCPQWASDPNWVPEIDIKEEKVQPLAAASGRPSMLSFNPKSPTTSQILGVSDELLKSFRENTPLNLQTEEASQDRSKTSTSLYQYPLTGLSTSSGAHYPLTGLSTSTPSQYPLAGLLPNSDVLQNISQIPSLSGSTEVTMSCTSLTPSVLPVTSGLMDSTTPGLMDSTTLGLMDSTAPNMLRHAPVTTVGSPDLLHTPGQDMLHTPAQDMLHTSPQEMPHTPDLLQYTTAQASQNILNSLSAGDKALFDSVVKTLSDSNPGVKDMNPIDVIMSLSMSSESLNSLMGNGSSLVGSCEKTDEGQS